MMIARLFRAATRLAAIAVLAVAGCARTADHEAPTKACPCEETNAKPVDQALVAWLSKARSLHHLADLAEADEQAGDAGAASIDKAIIKSPVDGVVVNRNLNPGQYPGSQTIFTVQQLDPVYAELNASSEDVFRIRRGATVSTRALARI